MIRLANYFNKTILVSIPSLFEDQQPRRFKLVGIEEYGLWLESEELAEPLKYPEKCRSPENTAAAFFPFSHIACVIPEIHPLALASRQSAQIDSLSAKRQTGEQHKGSEHHQKHHPSKRKGKKE